MWHNEGMPAVIVSMKEFAEERLGNKGKSIVRENRGAVYAAFADSLLRSVKDMTERSPVDTGLYASSWAVEPLDENNIFFGNTAPYAEIIEFGARPFRPPPGPIIAWCSRQLGLPQEHPDVRRFAWGVIKKIEKKGMEPKHIMTKGLNEVIYPRIEEALDRI